MFETDKLITILSVFFQTAIITILGIVLVVNFYDSFFITLLSSLSVVSGILANGAVIGNTANGSLSVYTKNIRFFIILQFLLFSISIIIIPFLFVI